MTEHTGVEQAPVAAEQQDNQETEPTYEDLFGGEETGEEDPAAAGQETEEGSEGQRQGEDDDEAPQLDEKVEKAFAKRLAAEREKIRREYEEKLQASLTEYTPPTSQYQPPAQPQVPTVDFERAVNQLADDLMITPEAARAMIYQQMELNRIKAMQAEVQDRSAKAEAKAQIEAQRQQNPHLPPFDEKVLEKVRRDHQSRTGYTLSWHDAYRQYVADQALAGSLFASVEQQAEQKAISQITKRNKTTVQAGKGARSPKPTSVWDVPDDEMDRLIERAKAGEFKKS